MSDKVLIQRSLDDNGEAHMIIEGGIIEIIQVISMALIGIQDGTGIHTDALIATIKDAVEINKKHCDHTTYTTKIPKGERK